jgi:hypothetical protein
VAPCYSRPRGALGFQGKTLLQNAGLQEKGYGTGSPIVDRARSSRGSDVVQTFPDPGSTPDDRQPIKLRGCALI